MLQMPDDRLDSFTDRERILARCEQFLRASQPGRLHLLAIKGNSGTGRPSSSSI